MTEYSRKEFRRLLDKVPETDPSKTEYHVLMQSIEMFNSIALMIDDYLTAEETVTLNREPEQDNMVPFTAPDFPAEETEEQAQVLEAEPQTEPTTEDAALTQPEMRKLLLEARGRGASVKEILLGFGVDNFQALPAEKYGALKAALEAV